MNFFISSPVKKNLLCFLLCMLPAIGHSQAYFSFGQLTVKDGLSQSNAVAIAQDSAGYLWIGTLDGLNRYDGNEFRVYKKYFYSQHSDKGYSHTGKVYADREGGLWIIPIEKIPEKYDPENDRFVRADSLREVSCMYQDKQLNFWFGSYGQGLFCLERKTNLLKQVLSPEDFHVHIHHITENREGNIVAAGLGAVFLVDQYSFRVRKITPIQGDTIPPVYYSVSTTDNNDNAWIGTYQHGLLFKAKNATAYQNVARLNLTGDPIPEAFAVMDLKIDRKNRLWIASYGKGLFMIDLNTKTSYNFIAEKHNPSSIRYNDIDCIYEDDAGVLWFGTDGAGLSFYDEHLAKFNSITNAQLPANIRVDVVRAIAKDKQGVLWIGTYGNGLTRYNVRSNQWKTYLPHAGNDATIASTRVISLLVDGENELWVGTQYPGGLSILRRDGRFRQINSHTVPALHTEAVWCIYEDSRHNYWLGTMDSGLILFDKKKGVLKRYTKTNSGIPSNNIRIITEGSNGVLWLGTESEGICSFNPESGQTETYAHHPSDSNSLAGNSIKSLHYDQEKNTLWIGTYGEGLCALEVPTETFHRFDSRSGLANDVIYGILNDDGGNLWLSSNKGVTRFTPSEPLSSKPEIVNYTDYDLVAAEFNTGAYYKDATGALYFGGMEGIYWIDPARFTQNKAIPKTTITRFEVFGSSMPMHKNMVLDHHQNTVSFSFTGFQFSMPAKSSYQYKLENHDREWTFLNNQNYVRYTNLKPGNYRFLVKAANYDGLWNPTPAAFDFRIRPPWYQTKTAWALYIALLIVALYLSYHYLKWHLNIQYQLTYNKKESERLKQIHDFKSKIFTDISHEIRTPLTLIAGPVERQLNRSNLQNEDRRDIALIQRNSERMQQLVDQLLDLSKLEAGVVKLNVHEGDITGHIKSIIAAFSHEASQKNLSFQTHIADDIRGWYDGDILEKVLGNLLSNAFKYATENGSANVEARKDGSYLQLIVSNTTEVPFSSEDIEQVFERFRRGHRNVEGAGIGLSIVKELVTLSHGQVEATMKSPGEIEFAVILPIHRAFFIENDVKESDTANPAPSDDELALPGPTPIEKPMLLIMEDHADIRKFIASVAGEEFIITEAENGQEGVRLALENIPDIIISDVMMPVMTGIEACRTLKNDERTSHIPIVLLTARTSEESELEGLGSGADDYLAKPFSAKKLMLKVKNLITSREALRRKYSTDPVLKPRDLAFTSADEKFLTRLQEAMEKNITDPLLNAETLSRLVGLSRMQLHRKLTALTGLSATAFIKSERCKLALTLIKDSKATVSEAAYATGFSSPSYFIKSFKDIYQLSPLEYLKKTEN